MAIERYDSSYDTNIHRKYVSESMKVIINELMHRALSHDMSKLTEPEKSCYDKYIPLLKNTKFGTPEYDQVKKQMEDEGLQHHFEVNRHHPEHFGERGVDAMNLFDLVEMFLDWLAASKRQNNGNLMVSIDKSCERFNITGTLANILRNTVDYFDAILSKEEK